MARTLIPMNQLQALLLAEIRTHDGCVGVKDVSIHHVTDDTADSNWSVDFVSCGSAAPNIANRAAIYAQAKLRREYNLLTD